MSGKRTIYAAVRTAAGGREKVFLSVRPEGLAFASMTWEQARDAHAALGEVLAKRSLSK